MSTPIRYRFLSTATHTLSDRIFGAHCTRLTNRRCSVQSLGLIVTTLLQRRIVNWTIYFQHFSLSTAAAATYLRLSKNPTKWSQDIWLKERQKLALSVAHDESQEIGADAFQRIYSNWKFRRDSALELSAAAACRLAPNYFHCSWMQELIFLLNKIVTWRLCHGNALAMAQAKLFVSFHFSREINWKMQFFVKTFVCDSLLTKWRNSCGGWLIAHCTSTTTTTYIDRRDKVLTVVITREWHDICSNAILKMFPFFRLWLVPKTINHRRRRQRRRPTTRSVPNARRKLNKTMREQWA